MLLNDKTLSLVNSLQLINDSVFIKISRKKPHDEFDFVCGSS